MSKSDNTIFKFDNFFKLAPVLIFLSFVYVYEYFRQFDISVLSIINLDDLLIAFLPVVHLGVKLTVLNVVFIIIPFIAMYVSPQNSTKLIPTSKVISRCFKYLSPVVKKKANKRQKKIFFSSLVNTLFNKTTFVAFAYLLFWITYDDSDDAVIVLSLLTKTLLISLIYDALVIIASIDNKKLKFAQLLKSPKTRLNIISVITFLFCYGWIQEFGRYHAEYVKENRNKSYISFCYQEPESKQFIQITSDKNLVLVDLRKNHVILRNLNKSTNFFYDRNKISDLKITTQK